MLLFWKYHLYLQEIHIGFSSCLQGVPLSWPDFEFFMPLNGSECKHQQLQAKSHGVSLTLHQTANSFLRWIKPPKDTAAQADAPPGIAVCICRLRLSSQLVCLRVGGSLHRWVCRRPVEWELFRPSLFGQSLTRRAHRLGEMQLRHN